MLNAEIASLLPQFTNSPNKWHVTLYQGAYKLEDLPIIIKVLQNIKIKPMTLTFTSIYNTADRWIDFGIVKTAELDKLHYEVVGAFNKYHLRPLARVSDIYNTLSKEKKEQVDKYGVSGVMEYYNPHLTVFYKYPADAALQEASKKIQKLAKEGMVCKASSIAIGELGYNGNIVNIIYKADIKIKNESN